MEIEFGKIYFNRTKIYLSPIVNVLGIDFNNVEAYGIYDIKYENVYNDFKRDYHLFILNNPYINVKQFNDTLNKARSHKYYVDDYLFDLNEMNKHMIVMKIPEEYHKSYDAFVIGRFSRMYTVNQLKTLKINKLTPAGKLNAPWHILTKDEGYRKVFIDKINKIYNTDLLEDDHVPREFDVFHINPKKEGFND